MGETKLLVCNERLEVPQAGGDMADRHIRYVGTMAMQSTAWSPIEMDGVLMSDQDVRYFHFGIEINVPDPSTKPPVPAPVPTCSFTTPINVESDYRKALGQLTTLFLRQRYTSLADVTACLIRPTMDFREKIEGSGTATGGDMAQKVRRETSGLWESGGGGVLC